MNTKISLIFFLNLSIITNSILGTLLYDRSQNNLPADQSWLNYSDNSIFGGSASQQANASSDIGVNLITDNAVSAGYSNYNPITLNFKSSNFVELNQNFGFTLSFDLQVINESHVSNDRAGFSVIILSNAKTGIELGFWEDEIWAQSDNPIFTHSEGVSFDTTATNSSPFSLINYDLTILGSTYTLFADNVQILTGATRDYTAFGTPYNLSSYLFLGDDTSSAAGDDILLGNIDITANVPEPKYISMFMSAFIIALISIRRILN